MTAAVLPAGDSRHSQHVTFTTSTTTSSNGNGTGVVNYTINRHTITTIEHDNPFRPGSPLEKEAEQMVKRISILNGHVTEANGGSKGSHNDSGIVASPSQNDKEGGGSGKKSSKKSSGGLCSCCGSSKKSEDKGAPNGRPTGGPGDDSMIQNTPMSSTILSTTGPNNSGLVIQVDQVDRGRSPESPPLQAEHVVVTPKGEIRASPQPQQQDASAEDSSKNSSKKKGKSKCKDSSGGEKSKKKCSIL